MQYDRRGLAITTGSVAAVRHIDAAVTSFLAHRRDTGEHVARALSADPDLAIAHCLAGFGQLLLGRHELIGAASQKLGRARASLALRGGTSRERRLCDALAAWCAGDMERSADTLKTMLLADPLDAMSAKLAHALLFMLGDAEGMRRTAMTIAPAWTGSIPERGFMLGCLAFAIEETGDYGGAERIGRHAVELEPFDVWGCHAVAHVYEMRGRAADGIAWLEANEDRLDEVNNFAYHMYWHRALFHLARREMDAVFDLYDRRIRAIRSDDYRDITNAAALLLRLERAGADVGDRWEELADLAERRIGDHTLVFAQLHDMLCLAGAGRGQAALEMLAAMSHAARVGRGTQARRLTDIGLPTAKAIVAGLLADDGDAAARMLPPRQQVARIGGSHAQREAFNRLLVNGTVARQFGKRRALLSEPASSRFERGAIAAPA